jgi:hypothetical protein
LGKKPQLSEHVTARLMLIVLIYDRFFANYGFEINEFPIKLPANYYVDFIRYLTIHQDLI